MTKEQCEAWNRAGWSPQCHVGDIESYPPEVTQWHSVPEPSSLILVLLAVFILRMFKRA